MINNLCEAWFVTIEEKWAENFINSAQKQEVAKLKVVSAKQTGRNDTEEKWVESEDSVGCHQANQQRMERSGWEKDRAKKVFEGIAKTCPDLLRDMIWQIQEVNTLHVE